MALAVILWNYLVLESAALLALVASLVSGANLSPLDLAEGHRSVGLDVENVRRSTLASLARTGVLSLTVQPLHVVTLGPPDTEGEDHTAGHGITHALGGTEIKVAVGAVSRAVLVVHPVVTGGVVLLHGRIIDDLAILDVEAAVLLQVAFVVGRELGDNGEWLGGVDDLVVAVVIRVAIGVGVVAASPFVADAVELALWTFALVESGLVARVRSKMVGAGVSLPDIELVAARAIALEVRLPRISQRIMIAQSAD